MNIMVYNINIGQIIFFVPIFHVVHFFHILNRISRVMNDMRCCQTLQIVNFFKWKIYYRRLR